MDTREIQLNEIKVSDFNIRKDLDAGTEDAGLNDLANSIREQGLLSPVTVRTNAEGGYDLIAGQRRFRAYRMLGMNTIPAILRDDLVDDTDVTVVSLVENVHRAELNPIDKARAYQGIYDKYGDLNRVARETGVTTPTVRKYLALLKLDPSIQDEAATDDGPAGVGTLSTLANTFTPEEQEWVLGEIGGFKQTIQQKILKQSGGDTDKIPALTSLAMEGAFDSRACTEGLCFAMPEDMKALVKEKLREQLST